MSSAGSVTNWLGQLRAGDGAAAQQLWERYFRRLVGLARRKLHGLRRAAADEEDVALSAFDSFYRGVERGRFPLLGDRHNLWELLVLITARKAIDLRQHETRQKRDSGREDEGADLEQIVGDEPTPELAAQVAEEFERLLSLLPREELRRVALMKLEGYTNAEVSAQLDCAETTVERRHGLIRSVWKKDAPA